MRSVTTAKRPLGVAVIGLGVGEQHARAYLETNGCALTRIVDLNPRRAREVAERLGVRVESSFDAVLANEDVDVVSIASYDDAHYDQVVRALDAGKHVFVEKPLCRTLEEVVAIKTRWASHPSLHIGSNLVLRSAPLYRWVRERISAGDFGDVYAIDGDYLFGRLQKITEGWRTEVHDYSVMLGGAVHLVDLMMWCSGQRPDGVIALGNRISAAGTKFRYNDFVAASFSFPSGLVGRITANFGCVHAHHHVLRVFGTKGTFIYDDRGARLHTSRDPESAGQPVAFAALPATKGALVPEFIRRIVDGIDPAPSVQHELDVIVACANADRALSSGQRVSVEYV